MNIKAELLKEHTLKNAKKIAEYASLSEANFRELLDCFLYPEYRVAQRAAWALRLAVANNVSLINPYLGNLVLQLKRTDVHDAVIRNTVRVLQDVTVPTDLHGELMDACFKLLEQPNTPVAIKAFSITILNNLSKLYPEIKHELEIIIMERWEIESPAFKARAKKIIEKSVLVKRGL